MSVSKKKRFEVFKRDKFTCQYCGNQPPNCVLELEHIEPRSKGGSDEYSNLTTACFDCNRGKSDRPLDENECDNVSMMQVETIAQLTAMNRMLQESVEARNEITEDVIKYLVTSWDWDSDMVSGKNESSVRLFMGKLNYAKVCEAIDIASAKSSAHAQWKYFCGICWRMIKQEEQ
jgi:hypothetical protein